MTKQDFFERCSSSYFTLPDYPFEEDFETAVIEALPVETESESQQDTEKVSDTDTGEENTTTQETEKAPSNGGCSGSVQGMSMLFLFVFAAMIPAVKRKKENE